MSITLTITKSEVFAEVAQTTTYTGAKIDDDANAYDRIRTVDEDQSELQRFWDESRAEVAQAFIRMLVSEGMAANGDTYNVVLNVSVNFDNALLPSMQLSLFSFFVQNIAAKWYAYTNKKEEVDVVRKAKALLDDVKEKSLYKKRPTRPTYN